MSWVRLWRERGSWTKGYGIWYPLRCWASIIPSLMSSPRSGLTSRRRGGSARSGVERPLLWVTRDPTERKSYGSGLSTWRSFTLLVSSSSSYRSSLCLPWDGPEERMTRGVVPSLTTPYGLRTEMNDEHSEGVNDVRRGWDTNKERAHSLCSPLRVSSHRSFPSFRSVRNGAVGEWRTEGWA